MKEAVIGGGRTRAEERELMGKNAVGNTDSPVTIGQYQGQIETHMSKLSDALQATKPIVEKDKTLKTNQAELKKQFESVKEQCRKIKELEPPKEYDYFKEQLRDDMKVVEGSIDQVFQGLAENDDKKTELSLQSIFEGLTYLSMTIDEIRKVES
ncbi:DUF6376 family protein [Bacillus paramycoides]|uniref:DUF6376 family protein n=1 Tax=Bacillus paramycoides TaxID=2026194 RepID=UPI003D2412CC